MKQGPVRITGTAVLPLHDSAATRCIEAAAQALDSQPALMARAGLATARLLRALAPHARRTLVLAGPGNNGGDGLVAARWLHTQRQAVQVRLLGDAAALPPDAAQALRAAAACGIEIRPFDPDEHIGLGPQDVLLDALLGIGARRAPEGAMAQAIALANRSTALRLAVDLPSGLHPDTGALLGTEAVKAAATLALLSLKPGCFSAEGREHCGELWWDDLGQRDQLQQVPASAQLAGAPPALPRHLAAHAGHKGSFGGVWALGGSKGMHGALLLAAGAALAAGAGRVHAAAMDGDLEAAATALRPELMQGSLEQALAPEVLQAEVLVAGCGAGQAVQQVLPRLLERSRRLVLDADALNALARLPALQPALRQRARLGLQTVLTPHPLEAARLLGLGGSAQVQQDRFSAARALAEQFQAWVVLKGSGSLVTAPGEPLRVNNSGNAALASPGSGDVLAGLIGGLWAQGLPVAQAVHAAVWHHGAAADRWRAAGHRGALRAATLLEWLAQA